MRIFLHVGVNLILLCKDCHNKEHDRFNSSGQKFDKDGNLEDGIIRIIWTDKTSIMGTKMEHNVVIEFIKTLVRASKNGNCIEENGEKIHNTSYLLNQTLRQYELKHEHYFISEKAILLWERLTSEDIMSCYYQHKVKCDRATGIIVREYVGNSKHSNERLINKDDVITYRAVFHDEHIVPINIIQQELNDLATLDDESVKTVLGKIRICRMLKEEDKETVNKRNRSSDYRKAIADNYTPKGIVCINVVTKERI